MSEVKRLSCYGVRAEIYERSWVERLFSWPWRPWRKFGTRKKVRLYRKPSDAPYANM